MEFPKKISHRDEILSLPIAIDAAGYKLYHCEEWCKSDNIVIVYDNRCRGWLRGKDHARYRTMKGVISKSRDYSKPFPAGEQMKITTNNGEMWAEDGGGAMFRVKIINV